MSDDLATSIILQFLRIFADAGFYNPATHPNRPLNFDTSIRVVTILLRTLRPGAGLSVVFPLPASAVGELSRFGLCSRSFPFRVLSDFAPRRRLRGPRPAPEVGIRVRPESARDRYPSRFLPRASLFRSVRVGPIGAAGPFRLVTVIRVAFFRGRPDSASSESAR